MRLLIVPAALLLALPSYADNLRGFYAGGSLDFIDGNSTDAAGNDVDFRSLEGFGGYKLNGWVGVEGRVGLGIASESFTRLVTEDTTEEVDIGIDHFESIYYRVEKSNQVAKLYGLIGFTNLQWTTELQGGFSESFSEIGPSYGVGVGFVMNEYTNLNFEYRQLINSDSIEFTTLSAGFDWRF